MAKSNESTVYVKKAGDRTLTRQVYTASDRVAAEFDGFVPESKAKAAAKSDDKPARTSRGASSGSSENAANNAG